MFMLSIFAVTGVVSVVFELFIYSKIYFISFFCCTAKFGATKTTGFLIVILKDFETLEPLSSSAVTFMKNSPRGTVLVYVILNEIQPLWLVVDTNEVAVPNEAEIEMIVPF